MEDGLGVQIDLRSDSIQVLGEAAEVARVEGIFADFEHLRRNGVHPHNGELNGLLKMVVADPTVTLRSLVESGKQRAVGAKRVVQPRSPNQRKYVEAIETHDMVFGLGPAGTGKTYLAVAMAVSALMAKKVSRIVLVRPAVEAGERLGFLPGSLQEKVDPYLRPLYDALYDLLDPAKVDKMLETNVIEVAPLAFMRGRTLNDAFIIMDEAQNTTIEQMKMFLTRLGNSLEGRDYGRPDADGSAQSEEERPAAGARGAGRSGGDSLLPLRGCGCGAACAGAADCARVRQLQAGRAASAVDGWRADSDGRAAEKAGAEAVRKRVSKSRS